MLTNRKGIMINCVYDACELIIFQKISAYSENYGSYANKPSPWLIGVYFKKEQDQTIQRSLGRSYKPKPALSSEQHYNET
ncbi:hypothetical protein AT730_24305 (plasmid) [Vibrio alginolyticus]|nr:hypothetical protein AT730_24305 [Vibrio alginolyticus]